MYIYKKVSFYIYYYIYHLNLLILLIFLSKILQGLLSFFTLNIEIPSLVLPSLALQKIKRISLKKIKFTFKIYKILN